MTPSLVKDAPTELLLFNDRPRYSPALNVVVLTRQPAGTAMRHQVIDTADHTRLWCVVGGSKVSIGELLEHRFVQLYISKGGPETFVYLH